MRRIGGFGVWELTATIVSRPGRLRPLGGVRSAARQGAFVQRVSTVLSNGESNIATGEITGSSIGTLSP
jgi:hypothetical protein